MANLLLSVTANNSGGAFDFTPDNLEIGVQSVDMVAGTANVWYVLAQSSLPTGAPRYLSRSWVDNGVIQIPLSELSQIKNADGTYNLDVFNALLTPFNLTANSVSEN